MSNTSENYANQEVTFLDVLKVCLKFKYLIIAITLAVTILGTLFIQLFYNASQRVYKSNFALYYSDVPNVVNSDLDFDFKSDKVVNQLKSNDALEGVNIEGFRTINMGLDFDRDLEKNYASFPYERAAVYYTWTSSQANFKSKVQAQEFVKALGEVAIELTREKIESVAIADYLTEAQKSLSFESELSYIQTQANLILSNYELLISSYGDSYLVGENTTLRNRVDTARIYLDKMNFTTLKENVESKSFVKYLKQTADDGTIYYAADANYIDQKEQSLIKMNKDIDLTTEYLAEAQYKLDNATETAEINLWLGRRDARQLELNNLNESKEELVASLNKMRNPDTKEIIKISVTEYESAALKSVAETADLRAKITECCENLKIYGDNYKEDILAIYNAENRIIYESKAEVIAEGGMTVGISILVTFVIGFALSLLVVFFVNVGLKAKASNASEKAEQNAEEEIKE